MKGRQSGGGRGPERRGPGGGRGPRTRGPEDRGPGRSDRSDGSDRGRPPSPPPPGARLSGVDEITVRVEKLVAGGEGLARYEGIPVFVRRSAPGDLVRARIVERRPDYGRAEIEEILEPGPARRPDPVPELSLTGVCDLQHLEDRVQFQLKAEAVRETLERIGGISLPANTEMVMGEPWGYRLRTQLHTEADPVTGGMRVGYHARGTNDVIPVSRCPLLVPELEALLRDLPSHLTPDSPKRLDVAAGDGGAVSVAPPVEGLPHGEVTTRVGDFTYAYDARVFFQSHRGLLPRLVEIVVGEWEGGTAVDLYAGVGLFSLPLAGRYGKVIAVEADQAGARYARLNVRRNKAANLEVVNQSVESWARHLPRDLDRVVADPPRGGLSRDVLLPLMIARPKRITYVSCHPAALARDLKKLVERYEIEKVTLIDLFPQTGHMETVVQLARREAAEV